MAILIYLKILDEEIEVMSAGLMLIGGEVKQIFTNFQFRLTSL